MPWNVAFVRETVSLCLLDDLIAILYDIYCLMLLKRL